jgi:predicted SprT family Zn-dependent metalloprotease
MKLEQVVIIKAARKLPKELAHEQARYDVSMGYCCPWTNGQLSIFINPDWHKKRDERALTLGHELAHAVQWIRDKSMSHDGDIFKEFKKHFCTQLGYQRGSF